MLRYTSHLSLIFFLSGCPGPSTSSSSFTEFAEAYGQAYCAALRECGQATLFTLERSQSCEDYVGELVGGFGIRFDLSVSAGRITFNSSTRDTCLASVRPFVCAGSVGMPAGCQAVFSGTVASGGACSLDTECLAGTICLGSGSLTCSTCQAPAASGSRCYRDSDCATGLACGDYGQDGGGGTCGPGGTLGQPCTNRGCAAPLTCNYSAQSPVCAEAMSARVAVGQPCRLTDRCEESAMCVLTTLQEGTCEALVPAQANGPCRRAIPDTCPTGFACDSGFTSVEGTCRPLAGLGMPCGVSACSVGLVCRRDGGVGQPVCLEPLANGAACDSTDFGPQSSWCQSGFCNEGVCAEPTLCL